jgi:hypothetical protein
MYKLAALALFAAALTSSYQSRLESLQAEARAQQKKLGFAANDMREKLYAQYPTPEVTFEGDPQRVSCGDTASLKLTGKWPKGTTFLFNDDDVQILEEKSGAGTYQAKFRVGQNAAPTAVAVHAIAPVSGAQLSTNALAVRARYDLDLKFDDGWTAHFTTEQASADSGQLNGTASWQKGGEKRQLRAVVEPQDNSRLLFRTALTEEEEKLSEEETEAVRAAASELDMGKMTGRVETCMKKPDPVRSACIEEAEKKSSAEAEAVKKKIDAQKAKFDARAPKAAWTCHNMELRAAAGALSGKATCGRFSDRELKVTGTLRCTGAIKEE